MATLRQIEANRRNAQKSTGPLTSEGRAAVRLNGIKHGLTAQTLTLPGEDPAEFEALLDSLQAEHQPSTPTQEILVREMAMAAWRLRRLYLVEAAFFQMRLEDDRQYRDELYPSLNDSGKLAYILKNSDNARTVANLARYEARLERSLHRALQDLTRLKKQELAHPPAPAAQALPREIGFASQPAPPPAPEPDPTPRPEPNRLWSFTS